MTERKSERVMSSFTPTEYAALEKAARNAHVAPADLCRVAVLDYIQEPPLSAVERAALRRLIATGEPAEMT